MRRFHFCIPVTLSLALLLGTAQAQEIKGRDLDPTPQNLALTWNGASVTLPGSAAGGKVWQGRLSDMPSVAGAPRPLVLILHGSSGIAGFIKEYQTWLATRLGLASIAPDSLAIPERLTYTSPIAKDVYERVHKLRLAELTNALDQVRRLAWVDGQRVVIMGTSEGAVSIARLPDTAPAGRLLYAWSCETNYFVETPQTAIPTETPVLAMIATRDPYFSPENPWNAGYPVTGSCAPALKGHKDATIAQIATDKHTIINFPAVQDMTAAFLTRTLNLQTP